ncbi:MAG: squalene--hopene cyclase [Planctomycetes bacterium]|nr:squalene--hopene cyclase [Planctomycetota bacterium]
MPRLPSHHDMTVTNPPTSVSTLTEQAHRACDRAVSALVDMQHEDGHWCSRLQGDSILCSEYILMKWILNQEDDPRLPRILAHLLAQQRPDDGAWVQYPGAAPDVSATVKAYLCLLLSGSHSDNDETMRRTEHLIRAHGGAETVNTFSMFYFACLGLVDWDACPAIPPELVFQPHWSPFHLAKMSAWSRTMVLPLAICSALRPVRQLPDQVHRAFARLFNDRAYQHRICRSRSQQHRIMGAVFHQCDDWLKSVNHAGAGNWPLRRRALQEAERWILDRAQPHTTEGLGAIFPPMVYLQIALYALGYPEDHPTCRQARDDLDALMLEVDPTDPSSPIDIQPCFSPVWDTGIALHALTECGYHLNRDIPGRLIRRAADWLADRQTTHAGDWSAAVPVEPGGWSFEYRNEWYPDVDDTAMVLMALHGSDSAQSTFGPNIDRGLRWLLAMQCEDGGWAAFDRTVNRPWLEALPFADHNAIQDPSCPDITGRVLECLGKLGRSHHDPAVQRAIRYLRNKQEPEGCWFGRWGVNYIYGTWEVLEGLRAIGCDMTQPWIRRAGLWLLDVQQADGSFGESPDTYEKNQIKGVGRPTASQTAWGAMGLLAVFGAEHPAVKRAIGRLCETQLSEGEPRCDHENPAGTWAETEFTGTGFPRVFYLRYHLYRTYFPMMALARYLRSNGSRSHPAAGVH